MWQNEGYEYGVKPHYQQYFSYIVAVIFIGTPYNIMW